MSRPHWICALLGHRYIAPSHCTRCNARPLVALPSTDPTAQPLTCECSARSFAIIVHDASGAAVRGQCAACVVREHVSVIQAARQAGFDPTAAVADFIAERLDVLEVIAAHSRLDIN